MDQQFKQDEAAELYVSKRWIYRNFMFIKLYSYFTFSCYQAITSLHDTRSQLDLAEHSLLICPKHRPRTKNARLKPASPVTNYTLNHITVSHRYKQYIVKKIKQSEDNSINSLDLL